MSTTNTTCTCPSGDGSLRWPCPTHPPTERDERLREARAAAARARTQNPPLGIETWLIALDDEVARLDAVVTAVREYAEARRGAVGPSSSTCSRRGRGDGLRQVRPTRTRARRHVGRVAQPPPRAPRPWARAHRTTPPTHRQDHTMNATRESEAAHSDLCDQYEQQREALADHLASVRWDNAGTRMDRRQFWLQRADVVLAVLHTRTVAQVKAEALREVADMTRFMPADPEKARKWLLDRSVELERGDGR